MIGDYAKNRAVSTDLLKMYELFGSGSGRGP